MESFLDSPTRHICEINYSTIAEKSERLVLSPKLGNSRKEQYRLKWYQLVMKSRKLQDMQSVFKYLKDANFVKKVRLYRLHYYFVHIRKLAMKQKWSRLSEKLQNQVRGERFNDKSRRLFEIRARQTADITVKSPEFLPDFSNLLRPSVDIDPVTSLRGEGENNKQTNLIERDISLNSTEVSKSGEIEKKSNLFNKDAKILYLITIVIGLVIGWIIYRSINKSLYSFLKQKTPGVFSMPIDDDPLFGNVKGLSQKAILRKAAEVATNKKK